MYASFTSTSTSSEREIGHRHHGAAGEPAAHRRRHHLADLGLLPEHGAGERARGCRCSRAWPRRSGARPRRPRPAPRPTPARAAAWSARLRALSESCAETSSGCSPWICGDAARPRAPTGRGRSPASVSCARALARLASRLGDGGGVVGVLQPGDHLAAAHLGAAVHRERGDAAGDLGGDGGVGPGDDVAVGGDGGGAPTAAGAPRRSRSAWPRSSRPWRPSGSGRTDDGAGEQRDARRRRRPASGRRRGGPRAEDRGRSEAWRGRGSGAVTERIYAEARRVSTGKCPVVTGRPPAERSPPIRGTTPMRPAIVRTVFPRVRIPS